MFLLASTCSLCAQVIWQRKKTSREEAAPLR